MKMGGGSSATRRRDLINQEEDDLLDGVAAALKVSANRDSVISTLITNLKLDPLNGRIGQEELTDKLGLIVECIGQYVALTNDKSVPDYKTLVSKVPQAPELSKSAKSLYETCATLANSFIPNGGYADTPPKVTPANSEGHHLVKTGHRRTIAYILAQPITNVSKIDVLIDKSKSAMESLYQKIGRIAENTARVDNTLAELMLSFDRVLDSMLANNEEVNKSSLAKATGIERTKLGRIIEVVQSGFAKDQDLIITLHDNKIEDAQSLCLLVRHPQEKWRSLLGELIANGSAWFRNAYREGREPDDAQTNESQQATLPVVNPDSHTAPVVTGPTRTVEVGQGRNPDDEDSGGSANNVNAAPLVNPHSSPPPEKQTTTKQGAVPKADAGLAKSAKERGAMKILELLRSADSSLVITFEDSAVQTLEALIIRLGQAK